MGQWKDTYNKVPRDVKIFFAKGIIVFVAWQILYYLLLRPTRVPDQALNNITAIATAKALSFFYPSAYALLAGVKVFIIIEGKKVLGIADPCNALEIFVLYTAFLFCYPARNKRRWLFTITGIPVIFIMNIFRCCLLTWLNMKHRGWFDISHHYIFTSAMYLLVFYLWMLYSKTDTVKNA